LKARVRETTFPRLAATPLPAIAALKDGGFVVVAKADDKKVLLQAPGVTQDSQIDGSIHVRNDHANVQFRINGVMLPDGITGFGSVLESGWIGSLSLVTGALPAAFGLRTVGLVDITTRTDVFNNSGTIRFLNPASLTK